MKRGLVLEGGGMRGAYTAGVLSWLIQNNYHFDYVVGISSGALYAGMYVLGKDESLKRAAIDVASHPRNVGWQSFKHERTLVGYNFLFKSVTEDLDYPLNQIDRIPGEIEIGVYDIKGQATVWKNKHDIAAHPTYIQAACTLPIVGRAVEIEGKPYMDGGITTMIPIQQSLNAGCERHFIVTTKGSDFVRKKQGFVSSTALKLMYRKYPQLVADFENRVPVYYQERALLDALVAEKKALAMSPSQEIGIKRTSGTKEQFAALYQIAMDDCEARREAIEAFFLD